ncbi:uncharacterized protein LOC122255813, partial [Penaeus japonicus]|uniref:uncharacterized protein LOC122255813 n=1 Tax=Penaeus japonicus TaxID=27405 RepID=UPI001C71533C
TKFRFHNTKFDECDLCRGVHLQDVALPYKEEVFWDCPFFEEPFYTNSIIQLFVMDGEGGGDHYYFRVPEAVRTNNRANATTWQLFLLLQTSEVERHRRLPVSVQLAPFGGLNYTVSLVSCPAGAGECAQEGSVVAQKVLVGPVEAPAVTRQETVVFPVTEIGTYVVTAQIVSPTCHNCTFLSISPQFDVKANKLAQTALACAVTLLLLLVLISGACILCVKHHLDLMLELARHPVKVLIVYLADTQAYWEFVEELASFLENDCHAHVFMVDTHAGKKSPYRWTTEHIAKSERILFLLPADLHGRSITPIINQWDHALNHFTSSVRNRPCAATVVLPFSDEIPCQIFDLRRFQLLRDLTSMVTWIHHGSVTPNHYIMWRLHINSLTSSVSKIRLRIFKATEEHQKREVQMSRDPTGSCTASLNLRRGETDCPVTSEEPVSPALDELQANQVPAEDHEDLGPGGEFDLYISSVEDLVEARNGAVPRRSSDSESDYGDNLLDYVL